MTWLQVVKIFPDSVVSYSDLTLRSDRSGVNEMAQENDS